MKNEFEVQGDITLIRLKHAKAGILWTRISTFDLSRANEFKGQWLAQWSPQTMSFYCAGNVKRPDGRWTKVYLHRWVTDAPDGMDVDHFDNDTLNNLRGNIRILEHAHNHQNRKGATKSNISKVRGVYWRRNKRKWVARYTLNGKSVYLGAFDTIAEAEKIVSAARAKHMPFSKDALI